MELTNDFRVSVPVEQAWALLTNVEAIAPCMPGAQLEEIEGDEYRGGVKVKVGPITAQYKGKATFVERDDAGHRAVLRAEGRDTKGQGNAAATITATATSDGDGTRVSVHTDLHVTGKVAQFGRGIMADVSAKLLGQFVECLEAKLASGAFAAPEPAPEPAAVAAVGADGAGGGAAATSPPAEPAVRKVQHVEAQPVDLMEAAGAPVLKRLLPVGLGALVLFLLLRRRCRRRRSRGQ